VAIFLTDLRAAVRNRTRIASNTSDPLAGDPALDSLINSAAREVAAEEPDGWPWMFEDVTFPTVGSTERYGFSTLSPGELANKVIDVWIGWPAGSVSPLPRVHRAQQRRSYDPNAPSTPLCWSVWGKWIYLAPVPNDVYTMYASVVLSEHTLVADTDFLLLPVRYQDAVVEKAAELLFRRMGNDSEAAVARAEYADWVKRMHRGKKEYTGPGRINYDLNDGAI
jgi:hypothetical protein